MTNRISLKLTMGRKALLAGAAALALGGPVMVGVLRAQTPATAFEVATIKPSDPGNMGRVAIQMVPGGGVQFTNVTLKQVVVFAYGLQPDQVTGGPSWMDSEPFDIVAKPEKPDAPGAGPMTPEARRAFVELQRARLRALIAERFKLQVAKETKEMPVYALVVGKNGHKLKASEPGGQSQVRMGRGQLNLTNAPMEGLANNLSRATGRTVIDKTGVKGLFDFTLEWTPDAGPNGGPDGPPGGGDQTGPTLFTALQEQLGLKLESQKAPIEVIVVTKAEKPTEN